MTGKQILIVLGGGRPGGNTARPAESCRKFTLADDTGFHDRETLPAGGGGDARGAPRSGETNCLERTFGQTLY